MTSQYIIHHNTYYNYSSYYNTITDYIIPHCPSHPGKEWTDWNHTTCPYGSSHPTVSWEGMDGLESSQSVPFAMFCTYCPSHPIVPWEGLDGQTRVVPTCSICYALYLLSTQSHCTMGGTVQTKVNTLFTATYLPSNNA